MVASKRIINLSSISSFYPDFRGWGRVCLFLKWGDKDSFGWGPDKVRFPNVIDLDCIRIRRNSEEGIALCIQKFYRDSRRWRTSLDFDGNELGFLWITEESSLITSLKTLMR